MNEKPTVGVFVTCLVDLFRPQIGFATVKLLENANCKVIVPLAQTCCGQPAYNNGDREKTIEIAKQVINMFSSLDYIVVPSGSCAGMLHKHYPELFIQDSVMYARAKEIAAKTFELTSFLVDVLNVKLKDVTFNKTVTYHDACSGLRELNIKLQPRQLLNNVDQLILHELPDSDVCCGFGGTFCVKYAAISNKMVTDKVDRIEKTAAEVLLAGDLGCLLNMAGKLKRLNSPMKIFHVAEVLANMANEGGIGEPL